MTGVITTLYVYVNWIWAVCLPPPSVWTGMVENAYTYLGASLNTLSGGGK